MKNFITIGLLVIAIFMVGCVKDKAVLVLKNNSTKLLTKTVASYPLSTSTTEYYYNKNNMLASSVSGDIETGYTYSGNKINYVISSVSKGNKLYALELTSNNKGLATKGTGQLLYNPASPFNVNISYEYDNDGYLVKQTTQQLNHTYVKTFGYINGDLINQQCYTDEKLQTSITYYYEKSVENKLNVMQVTDLIIPANGFMGKTSKYLWTKAEQVNTNGQKGYTQKDYTVDADGYPVSCKCKSESVSYTEKYTFSIQSK
jgi:hypothetical protein